MLAPKRYDFRASARIEYHEWELWRWHNIPALMTHAMKQHRLKTVTEMIRRMINESLPVTRGRAGNGLIWRIGGGDRTAPMPTWRVDAAWLVPFILRVTKLCV